MPRRGSGRASVRLALIAAFTGALSASTLQVGSAHGRQEDVRIAFRVSEAAVHLEVFSSAPFTIDPAALHFSLRPYRNFDVDSAAPPIAAGATLSTPVLRGVPQRPAYDIVLSVAPPAKPGMYQLSADTGYPDQYGTVASFRALDRWTYVEPAPFSWWVEFKNDRVVDVHPPGELP